jgi:farnesyl-diphosphate farnesyltransferase
MSLDISVKGPLLESFYLKLEENGWNFNGCASKLVQARGGHEANGLFAAAGPNEKDRALLVDFQLVIAEFKRLEPG